MVLPLILGLMTLAAWVCVSVRALCVCVCVFNTDSLSTCGPWFPACFGSNRDWNHDRHGLLPSYKRRSALNLEPFTVQPQLSSQPWKKKHTKIYMMDGNCLYWHQCWCILNTFFPTQQYFQNTESQYISIPFTRYWCFPDFFFTPTTP